VVVPVAVLALAGVCLAVSNLGSDGPLYTIQLDMPARLYGLFAFSPLPACSSAAQGLIRRFPTQWRGVRSE